MSDFDTLSSDLARAADVGGKEATGFHAVYCPVCNKNDRKTGGFKFEPDKIIYNCFRGKCDATCVYEEGTRPSKRFRELCDALRVDVPPGILTIKSSLQEKIEKQLKSDLYEKNEYHHARFDYVVQDDLPKHWVDYLNERRVDPSRFKYIATGDKKDTIVTNMRLYGKDIAHIMIASYGYYNHRDGNEGVILVPEGKIGNPVILVEGTMDALCFPNTVAVMQSKITPKQAYHLRGKDVIMIPDRHGGNKFHEQFHRYGWKLCVPPWKEKDLNAAVVRYGKIAVARMIMENLYEDRVKGEAAYRMWQQDKKGKFNRI